MTRLADLSVADASTLVAGREVSCSELVDDVLRRIAESEDSLHAYAALMEESAREAASAADDALEEAPPRSPLHGIPFSAKDVIHALGGPIEEGSRARAGRRSAADATVIARLRDAGAILLGKTVTHELQLGVNSIPTRNAWNPLHIPGGSSAGSAVSVAAGSAAFALGTDTGGSVRVPAAFNGVTGLKPTYGLVSGHGLAGPGGSFTHVGPMARTSEDLALVLRSIAGRDPADPASIDEPVPHLVPADAALEGMRLGVDRDHFYAGAASEVVDLVEVALRDLESLGAAVVPCRIPELELMEPAGTIMALSESTAEYLPAFLATSDPYDPRTATMIKVGVAAGAPDYVRAQRSRPYLRDRMRAAFERHRLDALFGPTAPVTAPRAGEEGRALVGGGSADDLSGGVRLSLPASVTGQPALTVPCGLSDAGMPVGFQLVGRPFGEDRLLRIGHAYERLRPWHRTRPPLPEMSH